MTTAVETKVARAVRAHERTQQQLCAALQDGLDAGMSLRQLAAMLNVSHHTVSAMLNRNPKENA